MVIKHSTAHVPNDIVESADWNANHTGTATPEAHTLASHSTKAHAELTNVTSDQHHAQLHNAASHTDIASTGAQIDDAVSKKHTQNTDTILGTDCVALDHGAAATDMVINVSYGTGDPPAANTTTEGSLFVKYTA